MWHPDVCTKLNAHERSVKIIEAHKILTNPQTRGEYDYLRKQSYSDSFVKAEDTTTYSNYGDSFARAQQAEREQARQDAGKTLNELLNMFLDGMKSSDSVEANIYQVIFTWIAIIAGSLIALSILN